MKQIKPILSMIIALLYFILGFIIIFSQSNLILNVIDIITILFLIIGVESISFNSKFDVIEELFFKLILNLVEKLFTSIISISPDEKDTTA